MAFIKVTTKDGRDVTLNQDNIVSVGQSTKRDTSHIVFLTGRDYPEKMEVTDAEGTRISDLLTSTSDTPSA